MKNNIIRTQVNEEMFLLMYHGGLIPGRGIEKLIELTTINPNIALIILGEPSTEEYYNSLINIVDEMEVRQKVVFHDAVSIQDLWKYVGAADVGMMTIPAIAKSYYYMLPNKFFENIQSEVPVICSDFPAIAPLVKKYDIGLTCNPNDVDDINACVERLRQDRKLYNKLKNNTRLAKQDLCWEKEKEVLKNAYKDLI